MKAALLGRLLFFSETLDKRLFFYYICPTKLTGR